VQAQRGEQWREGVGSNRSRFSRIGRTTHSNFTNYLVSIQNPERARIILVDFATIQQLPIKDAACAVISISCCFYLYEREIFSVSLSAGNSRMRVLVAICDSRNC